MKVVIADLWLCVDCMQYAVNGELPPDTGSGRDAEIMGGIDALGYDLVPDFGEEGDGEDEFSWCRCEACGSELGGARYRFAILGEDA